MISTKNGAEFIKFPVIGGNIIETEKKNLVIKQNAISCIYYIAIRGSSEISLIIAMNRKETKIMRSGHMFHSGQGAGETAWAIVNVPQGGAIIIKGKKLVTTLRKTKLHSE